MSGSAPRNLLVSLRPHTRLVVFLGLLAAFVAIPVTTGYHSLTRYAGPALVVGALLEHVAYRYVAAGRPRRAIEVLSYVFLAVSLAVALAVVWPLLAR